MYISNKKDFKYQFILFQITMIHKKKLYLKKM